MYKSYNLKRSNLEYRKQEKKMLGRDHPTLDNLPLQEGSEAEVVLPPNNCLEPHLGSSNVPVIPIPPNQEELGRDKDLKNLLKTI